MFHWMTLQIEDTKIGERKKMASCSAFILNAFKGWTATMLVRKTKTSDQR